MLQTVEIFSQFLFENKFKVFDGLFPILLTWHTEIFDCINDQIELSFIFEFTYSSEEILFCG
jgi:hypothetical protein